MKSIYIFVAAIITLAIIVGSVFVYTALQSPSATPTPSPSSTPAATQTPQAIATPTLTNTPTATETPLVTSSPTTTPSPAATSTPIPTSTPTPTSTPVATPTPTPIPTASPTPRPTPTPTPSLTPIATPGPATLTGSGATFPQPFLNSTIVRYTTTIRTNLQINYQGGGSGRGVSDFTSKLVDFACSDAALTASQTAALPAQAVHIPETIGAITICYNLPGISTGLRLNGDILARIYLGTITSWNDPAIVATNPALTLPNHAITTVHRAESSGTTNWFTKYLAIVSSTWSTQIGSGTSVQWPGGIGQSGNSNVASTVNQTQYSIGYVELAYALQNGLTVVALQNSAGNYVLPSLQSTTAAAESIPASGLPPGTGDWSTVNILNTPGAQAYPICNPTYMLIYKELSNIPGMTLDKATQLVQYFWYVVHDGQQLASVLQYAALPSNIMAINEATLNSITFNGQTLPTH
jgi:phosphate transport system substrate-binding protein